MRIRRVIYAAAALVVVATIPHVARSQGAPGGADAVASFTPGSGQNSGQGPEFFPANVLGLPDTSARPWLAAVAPEQICSLGLGGEIVLRFDSPILDGTGPDFTVFENAFHYTIGGVEHTYAEPGEVAVSRNGVDFTAFPFDTLSLRGCAGVTPVNGDQDPTDPSVSGGDSFDLAELGIDSIRFVRIRDVTAMVKDNPEHPYWDPTLSGFDLDAVVATRHVAQPARVETWENSATVALLGANPFSNSTALGVRLDRGAFGRVELFDGLGRLCRLVDAWTSDGGRRIVRIDARDLAPGAYLAAVRADGRLVRTASLRVMR